MCPLTKWSFMSPSEKVGEVLSCSLVGLATGAACGAALGALFAPSGMAINRQVTDSNYDRLSEARYEITEADQAYLEARDEQYEFDTALPVGCAAIFDDLDEAEAADFGGTPEVSDPTSCASSSEEVLSLYNTHGELQRSVDATGVRAEQAKIYYEDLLDRQPFEDYFLWIRRMAIAGAVIGILTGAATALDLQKENSLPR